MAGFTIASKFLCMILIFLFWNKKYYLFSISLFKTVLKNSGNICCAKSIKLKKEYGIPSILLYIVVIKKLHWDGEEKYFRYYNFFRTSQHFRITRFPYNEYQIHRLKILLEPLIYYVDTNSEKRVYFVLCTTLSSSDNTFHSELKIGWKLHQFN